MARRVLGSSSELAQEGGAYPGKIKGQRFKIPDILKAYKELKNNRELIKIRT